MRANRSARDHAEVGVGTLIVFIAMVLVAAIAASVIIGTTGQLQQRASETGKEATSEVSSNFIVEGFYGVRNNTSSQIYTLKAYLALSAGATELDMSSMVIRYSDGVNVQLISYTSATNFTLTWLRGVNTNNILKSTDLVEVAFHVPLELAPRSDMEIHFIPEHGSTITLNVRTPATYGTETTLTLR